MGRISIRLLVLARAAAAAACAACSSDTAIFLTIESNLRVPDEMDALRVEVETVEKPLMNQSYGIESQDDLPATLTIIAENDKEAEVHIVVTGLKGAGEVGSGEAWATFIRGKTVDVSIVVARSEPGEDGGRPDAGRDAGAEAERDTGADSGTDAPADGPEDDAGPGDAAYTDVRDADTDDVGDLPDAEKDSGYWIGSMCSPDGGCGVEMTCLAFEDPAHGMCTSDCGDAGCPEGAWCLNGAAMDVGSICVRECTKHTDCLRPDLGCYGLPDAGSGCTPNLGEGGSIVEYPHVQVTPEAPNPAIGESVQLVAKYFDEEHEEVNTVSFTWYSSDNNIAMADASGLVEAVAFGEAKAFARALGLEGYSEVSVEAIVTTLAGDGTDGFVDGKGSSARFSKPEFLVVAGTEIFASDFDPSVFQPALRKVTADGTVTTWSRAQAGCADGDLFSSGYQIDGLTNQSGGSEIYFSDSRCNAIRKFTPTGVVTVFTSEKGFADGDRAVAKIDGPGALKAADDGILFFDANNHRIRLLSYDGGSIITVAGSGDSGSTGGPAIEAQIENVGGIGTTGSSTSFYFTERSHHVIKRVAGGQVRTLKTHR